MPSDLVKAFPFLFYLQITFGIEMHKERTRRNWDAQREDSWSLSRSPFPFWTGSDRHNTALIAILPSRQSCRSRSQHHAVRSRLRLRRAILPLVKPSRLSLFLLLSIWPDLMIFFSGFCLCFSIEEWMILYICLAAEKMWATSRKYVFYGIFKNKTKHQKIFFKTFFEMQQNTWKYFPFRKIFYMNQTQP